MSLPRRATLATAALCVALGAPAGSQGQARVRTEVDTALVTVGDRVTLAVSVEHAPDARVVWPDSLTLAPFEVLEAALVPPRASPAGTVSTLVLSLAAFELGELEIPSFELAVVGPSEEVETLRTDRYGVEVVSVGRDESGDIREIRGLMGIPLGASGFLISALLLLAPALLAYLLYRRYRRPDGAAERAAPGPPPRPAHEVALEALDRLERSPLLERGDVKTFHIEVSEILRVYVEGRFRVEALEMTTREVLGGLERAGARRSFVEGLGGFLGQCDLVKFAKVRPDSGASLDVLRLGRRLVEETVPVAPPRETVGRGAAGPGLDSDRTGTPDAASGGIAASSPAAAEGR